MSAGQMSAPRDIRVCLTHQSPVLSAAHNRIIEFMLKSRKEGMEGTKSYIHPSSHNSLYAIFFLTSFKNVVYYYYHFYFFSSLKVFHFRT